MTTARSGGAADAQKIACSRTRAGMFVARAPSFSLIARPANVLLACVEGDPPTIPTRSMQEIP
jgi:hypothetical protein